MAIPAPIPFPGPGRIKHPREPTLLVKKRARSLERLKSQLIPPRSVPLPRASRRGVSEKPEKTSALVINHHRDHLAPAEAAVTCCHLLSKWPEPPAASPSTWGHGELLLAWAGLAPAPCDPISTPGWGRGDLKTTPRVSAMGEGPKIRECRAPGWMQGVDRALGRGDAPCAKLSQIWMSMRQMGAAGMSQPWGDPPQGIPASPPWQKTLHRTL